MAANANKIYLKQFIENSKRRFENILKQLNWTEQNLIKRNVASDQLLEEQENDFPVSIAAKQSVTLEQRALEQLLNKANVQVPQKFSDLQLNFSREQKLKIYETVVAATASNYNATSSIFEHEKAFTEIVAKQKREKRKRRKYRTMKPTYMEELKTVVDMQMQAVAQYLQPPKMRKRHSSAKESRLDKVRRSRSRERHLNRRTKHKKHK